MRFKSELKAIYSTRLARRIEFKRKHYSTDDPAEIAVLRSHPLVEEASERRKPERTPDPVETGPVLADEIEVVVDALDEGAGDEE